MGGVGLRGEGVCGGIARGRVRFVRHAFLHNQKMHAYLILWSNPVILEISHTYSVSPNGECSMVYSMQAITFVGKAKFKKHFVTFCKSSYLSNSNESGSWLKIMT